MWFICTCFVVCKLHWTLHLSGLVGDLPCPSLPFSSLLPPLLVPFGVFSPLFFSLSLLVSVSFFLSFFLFLSVSSPSFPALFLLPLFPFPPLSFPPLFLPSSLLLLLLLLLFFLFLVLLFFFLFFFFFFAPFPFPPPLLSLVPLLFLFPFLLFPLSPCDPSPWLRSFGSIKPARPLLLCCEAMDRSRSPHRTAAPVAGTRPLVNFPVWSGPNTSDIIPRGPGLQPGQTPTHHWNQGTRRLQPSQGLPLTQDSQQIPPGQVGQSQQFVGLSQQCGHTPQTQGWGPGYGSPVAPRPHVHGMGLGGMVSTFPPTPPTWTSSQFPGQFHGHFRPPQFGPSQRPTQATPSSRSNSGTPHTPGKTPLGRIPNIPLGQHWKPDEEHYDTQKLNGLTLPRTIRASSWTQLKDIEGCDPLTVPLYQGSENFWLRKLAAGREVYVATMGEVSQVVFVSEILSQLRSRGIDLDKLAQHKALQDGHALEKREAIQSLAKQIGDQLQRWSPSIQADTSSQHKIAELEARLAALQAAANQPQAAASHQAQVPAQAPEAPSPSPRVPSPIEAALQGQRPTAFNCWLALAAIINGWKATWLIPSVTPNTNPGSKTWSLTMLPDKPLRETLWQWIIGGKTNQKKQRPLFIVLLCARAFLQPRSNQDRMKTYWRSSLRPSLWLLDYAQC